VRGRAILCLFVLRLHPALVQQQCLISDKQAPFAKSGMAPKSIRVRYNTGARERDLIDLPQAVGSGRNYI
jgi:hypothetical protein